MSAEECNVKGNNCVKSRDFESAIKHYKRGLILDPENAKLNCNLAQVFLKLENYPEAEKYAKNALEYQCDYVKAFYRAAKAALGRHAVYDSMTYIFQGVLKCQSEDIEELFVLARELSPYFEVELRKLKKEDPFKPATDGNKHVNGTRLKDKSAVEDSKVKKEIRKERENENAQLKEQEMSVSGIDPEQNSYAKAATQTPQSKMLNGSEIKIKCDIEQLEEKRQQRKEREKNLEVKDTERKESGKEYLDEKDSERIELAKDLEMTESEKDQDRNKQRKEEVEKEQIVDKQKKKVNKKKNSNAKEEERIECRKEHLVTEEKRKLVPVKKTVNVNEQGKNQSGKECEKRDFDFKEKTKKDQNKHEIKSEVSSVSAKREQGKINALLKSHSSFEQQRASTRKKEDKAKRQRLKEELHHQMKEASQFLMKGIVRKAVDAFNCVLNTIKTNPPVETLGFGDPMDLVVIQFSYCEALILSHQYMNLVKAIEVLENMRKEGMHIEFPAIYLSLGRAFICLNRFQNAKVILERGLSFLSRGSSFSCYSWPGTSDVIEFSIKEHLEGALENYLQMSKHYHKPDAICMYENCIKNSQHIVPSRNIFFSDPDFCGFVDVICQEQCHVYFHSSCWKDFKENLSEVEKISEKDFLGRDCLTPDCLVKDVSHKRSVIIKVSIIGVDGEEKSSCEITPPTVISNASKEGGLSDKTPKRKQSFHFRLKDCVKTEKCNPKRIRHDSKSQGDLSQTPTQPAQKGYQFNDALCKLKAARNTSFGYEEGTPEPFKLNQNRKVPVLNDKEEFVYSYFLEIFKNEGYMSIYKLQDHWEASKELLPVLEPALITHTDLVKFLLDTEAFAVVQDMIGIAAELPNISAIVEGKSESINLEVYGWKPSEATVSEVSKTLSFSSSLLKNVEAQTGPILSKKINTLEFKSLNDDCPIDTSQWVREESFKNFNGVSSEFGYDLPSHQIHMEDQFSKIKLQDEKPIESHNYSLLVADEAVYKEDINKSKKMFGALDSDVNHNLDMSLPNKTAKDVSSCRDCGSCEVLFSGPRGNPHRNDNSSLGTFKQEAATSRNISSPSQEMYLIPTQYNINTLVNTTNSVQVDQEADIKINPLQSEWKPRAKLAFWISEKFPEEPKERLWDALRLVRAQNNNTLSHLTSSVIAERVKHVLYPPYDDF